MRLLLALAMVATLGADYARPELLIDPLVPEHAGKLKASLILDVRPKAGYDAGHAPGSRWVDIAEWTRAFGAGDDAAGWSKRISALGISADSPVVVLDDVRSRDAARVWWILRYWGVKDVRILNGGWSGWTAAKFPVDAAAPRIVATTFQATPATKRHISKTQLLKTIPTGTMQLVDARSTAEHCGTQKMNNKRGGAMPGAKHLDWVDLLDKSGRFKSADELTKLFAAAGIDPKAPSATYCQSGGRASVMAFALELMGNNEVANYHASWAEWGNADDTPIVTPPDKKK
ncbi:MAG: sulfurtransferase [Gemmataceae bacterium]|nr:sulfurtransferase [Gemmataceae bacterium]